jgi:uracil-DNA glycosylase
MQPLITNTAEKPGSITWSTIIEEERAKPYLAKLLSFIDQQRAAGKAIYPADSEVFYALELTEFEKVSAVIIGQDPYHDINQAHGLAFSVPTPTPAPPSLVNIFAELDRDLGIFAGKPPKRNSNTPSSLEMWATQGVLLLNSVLTVEAHRAGSHASLGWEVFTDRLISELNSKRSDLVFMLWGSYAQRKGEIIDRAKHLVLTAPHPSPLSAHRGFIGCGHFGAANRHLASLGKATINWGAGLI